MLVCIVFFYMFVGQSGKAVAPGVRPVSSFYVVHKS